MMRMPPPPISCPSPELVDARKRLNVTQHRRSGARALLPSSLGPLAVSSQLRWQTLQRLEQAGSGGISPPVGQPAGKRWREDDYSPSPRRPQRSSPSDSVLTFTKSCPTFMLAPHSAVKAPDTIRRQLKVAYLASLVQRSSDPKRTSVHMTPPLADRNEPASPPGVSKVGPPSGPARDEDGCLLPQTDEKSAIVCLLSRQLACMHTIPRHRSPRASESSPGVSATCLRAWSPARGRRSSVAPLTASPLRRSSQHAAAPGETAHQAELHRECI